MVKPTSSSCVIFGRPDRPSSIVAPVCDRRRRPAAAAPPSQLDWVGLARVTTTGVVTLLGNVSVRPARG